MSKRFGRNRRRKPRTTSLDPTVLATALQEGAKAYLLHAGVSLPGIFINELVAFQLGKVTNACRSAPVVPPANDAHGNEHRMWWQDQDV